MRARGLSYAEIARELQVSRASIGSDVQYLREQAKGAIREYLTEHLPEQYQVCLTALYQKQATRTTTTKEKASFGFS
jgi:hypothetical protein